MAEPLEYEYNPTRSTTCSSSDFKVLVILLVGESPYEFTGSSVHRIHFTVTFQTLISFVR